MAEETVVAPTPVVPAPAEVAVVAPQDTTTQEKSAALDSSAPIVAEPVVTEEEETDKPSDESAAIAQSDSFKEESNRVSDLEDPEKKALDEFKILIQEALNKHDFTLPPPPPVQEVVEEEKKEETPVEAEAAAVADTTPVDTVAADADATPEEAAKSTEEEPPKATEEATPAVEKTQTLLPPPPGAAPIEKEVKKDEKISAPVPVVKESDANTAAETTVVLASSSTPVDEVEETTTTTAGPPPVEEEQVPPPPPEEVFIWGIPLLGDEKSDTVLLKFLRARDFKVKDAFTMLRNTVLWRKEFGIEGLLEEDLGSDLDKVVFMNGFDKEGHPVCYNVYGEFQNKELYQKTFSDEEKSQKFLRWRIQFLEKSIQKLDFSPGGICTIVQVNDLKNSPGPLKTELRQATNQALSILQDNYPEFVAKQIFINVPWWYLAFNKMISPFLTLRTKSKFVFAGPSKSAETLFKYVAPEQVPVQYGGLNKQGEEEFTTADAVTEVIVKPASKHTIEIPVTETCSLVWELRVIGWDVSYGAEFVPSAEDGYTIIVQKARKINAATDEPVINNSFKTGEPGKVVLTIDNSSSKKKKLLYRFNTKPASD